MSMFYKTIKNETRYSGVGLHTGSMVNMILKPSAPKTGIVFWLPYNHSIRALWNNVSDTKLCTVLYENGKSVETVEHLMAALSFHGITDLIIELNGNEIPVADGSATEFVNLITDSGIKTSDVPLKSIRIDKPVEISELKYSVGLYPADRFSVELEIEFANKIIGYQYFNYDPTEHDFTTEIAPARTFGTESDVGWLLVNGYGLGGSLDNAVVFTDTGVMNEGGLRFDDEPVRHKILDIVGDLHLVGAPIIGKFVGNRSGHFANNMILRKLFEDENNFSWV